MLPKTSKSAHNLRPRVLLWTSLLCSLHYKDYIILCYMHISCIIYIIHTILYIVFIQSYIT